MLSADIRQSFLNFFAGRGHQVLPSSSLVPHEDTSVLLTTAGMQQFKPIFMGLESAPAPRATTVQKCFRTSDLEEVGDLSHLTFFEMLGNFSFGDYFKDTAIEFCWEYLTKELGINPARLQPTIHPDDAESAAAWPRVAGKAPHRLTDNIWAAGPTGPFGHDSEVYFDWGLGTGCGRSDCFPSHCDRYLEVWNLVFMQFDRRPDGTSVALAKPGVDTGMGLERLAAVLRADAPGTMVSIFETDVFERLRRHFEELSGIPYAMSASRTDVAQRLLADHARATAFLVADGVRPGNEGRGYVLRRMVRRATLSGQRKLGIDRPISGALPVVLELMGDAYPELGARRDAIAATLEAEEAAFERTLEAGQAAFADVVSRSAGIVRGEDSFRLHDTYGFPIDLTVELAGEHGLSVDREGFAARLAEARQQSRRGARKPAVQRTGLPATEFLGYQTMAAGGRVVRLFSGDREVDGAVEGDDVEVYLDRTPMYAEGGGQVGDIGVLEGPSGTVEVRDVQRQGSAFAHYGRVASGEIRVGQDVQAEVDEDVRWATMRHHSATHLLHRALREVLGPAATQAGSYVGPETCTFDFSFDEAVGDDRLEAIFSMVNRAVRDDLPKTTRVMPLEEARQSGAMMLFGEKYGDNVRVVSFGEFTTELCGGTHVDRTGQLGVVTPVAERSVQAGVRRIEFLAGERAERHIAELTGAARRAAADLRVAPAELPGRVEQLNQDRRTLQKEVDDLRRRLATGKQAAGSGARDGVAFQHLEDADVDLLRAAADALLDRVAEAEAAIVMGGSGQLVVKTRRGGRVDASQALTVAKARVGGGSGGGKETLAQGGGFKADDLEAIVAAVAEMMQAGAKGSGS